MTSFRYLLKFLPIRERHLRLALAAARAVKADAASALRSRSAIQKPTTLNLLVNDICNSRCQMCNVWRMKRDVEISPQQLGEILRDPLFDELAYVGVSGGEPTLRKDLADIYRVLAQKSPRLMGAGIITNAINKNQVIERVLDSAQVCAQAGIPFSAMVSLDGVGRVHDRVRGTKGNYDAAIHVLRYLRQKPEIHVSFGCTITKDNLWHLDELLDFAREEGLYGRFRIAEYIRRLYNEDLTEYIRNFSPLERYHLTLFFAKLEAEFESHPIYQHTYRNIRGMLQGEKRAIACPYQTAAVTLDCRGQLYYCAPKSPILGNTLQTSAYDLYTGNLQTREDIKREYCGDCIHDYHTPPTTKDFVSLGQKRLRRFWQGASLSRLRSLGVRRPKSNAANPRKTLCSALIVGWYGTETAGDKAILGELVHQLYGQGVHEIALASLYPYVSKWTVSELGYPDLEIIPAYSSQLARFAATMDQTIMGGGPLMDLETLGVVLDAFAAAKKAGRQTRIAGCGIGPLARPRYVRAVKRILQLADAIELRDSQSADWVVANTERRDVSLSGDLAAGYVRRWDGEHPVSGRENTLNCYLRDWSREYQGSLTEREFQTLKTKFEAELGAWIRTLCAEYGLRPRLLPMHHFFVGGDDRDFSRRFAANHLEGLEAIVEAEPMALHDLLHSMRQSRLNLCMRFHSVLFAHTLNAPFVAIDYTQGGKTRGYLADVDGLDRMISLAAVAAGEWRPFKGVRA